MITSPKFSQTTDPKFKSVQPKMNKLQKTWYNKMTGGKGKIVKRGGPAWKGKDETERDVNPHTGLAKTNSEKADKKLDKKQGVKEGSKKDTAMDAKGMPPSKGKKGVSIMIAVGVPKKGMSKK